jgi:hypothetical protein
MRADLWSRKLTFKAKTQPANSSNGHRGDERHNTEIDGRIHSEEVEIADLVGKHLQIKEKTRMGGYEWGIERERESREQICSLPLSDSVF